VELRKCIDELTSVFSSASVSAQREHTRGEGDDNNNQKSKDDVTKAGLDGHQQGSGKSSGQIPRIRVKV